MDNRAAQTPTIQERFADVFSRLPAQDIEQFYAHYQIWTLRHRVPILEMQLEILQEHITGNLQLIQDLRPSAVAQAVLARLQSKGVEDVDVLDRMLEQGENWLDRMMQRLDYCEQVEDFIQGDYTQWCINSLEGAYDWIDSLRDSPHDEAEATQIQATASTAETLVTEEILLQKLKTDDEEAMWEVTLKPRTTAPLAALPEQTYSAEEESSLLLEALTTAAQAETAQPATIEPAAYTTESTQEQLLGTEADTTESTDTQNILQHLPATDDLLHFDQPGIMNDWITALQADTTTRIEAGETEAVEYSPTEMIPQDIQGQETASEVEAENTDITCATENGTSLSQEEDADKTITLRKSDLHYPPLVEAENSTEVSATSLDTISREEDAQTANALVEADVTDQADNTRPGELEETASLQPTNEIPTALTTFAENEVSTDLASSTELETVPGTDKLISEEEASSEALAEILPPVQSEDAIDETGFASNELLSTSVEANEAEDQITEETTASVPGSAATQTLAHAPEAELAAEETTSSEELIQANTQRSAEQPLTNEQYSMQADEIEVAALTNTLLDTEEAEGQMAWYEYLEIDAAGNKVHSNIEEHLTQEEVQPARLQESSASYELADIKTRPNTQGDFSNQEAVAEFEKEQNEPTSEETWVPVEDSDQTLPLLLKDISQAYRPEETIPQSNALEAAEAEQALSANSTAQHIATAMPTAEAAKPAEIIAQEEETLIFSEYNSTEASSQESSRGEQPGSKVETRIETNVASGTIPGNRENVRSSQVAQPMNIVQTPEKPRKLRFWQRWFRRKPKNVV